MTMQGELKSVVVPVDFSDQSLAAVDVALDLASEPEGVSVVHVLPDISVAAPGMIWDSIDDEGRCRHAREALQENLNAPKYRGIRLECTIGDPGICITNVATRATADLIVMPSHGRRGLKRLLLGSVAERVLRLADCDVLILKPPRK